MLKKEVTGSSKLPGGAVPTRFIWTVEPPQVSATFGATPSLLYAAGLPPRTTAPTPGKAPAPLFGTSATEWQSPMSRQGTHLLCWAQENHRLFSFHAQSRQGQTALPAKRELYDWPEARPSQSPFSEDMDLSVHNDPPRHRPPCTDMLCRVMSTSRACMAWEWRTHKLQAAYGRCSPSNAHWSSTSFSGHTIERGKEKGREEMRRKAQKLFTH